MRRKLIVVVWVYGLHGLEQEQAKDKIQKMENCQKKSKLITLYKTE